MIKGGDYLKVKRLLLLLVIFCPLFKTNDVFGVERVDELQLEEVERNEEQSELPEIDAEELREPITESKEHVAIVPGNEELLITIQPLEVLVGTPMNHIDFSQALEIRIGDQVIDRQDYSIRLRSTINKLQTVGATVVEAQIVFQEQSQTIHFPVKVIWGSSIQHYGSFSNGVDSATERTIGAYTWHPGFGISHAPITLENIDNLILSQISSLESLEVTSLSVFSGTQTIRIGTSIASQNFRTHGSYSQETVQAAFSNNYPDEFIPAQVGDVVESRHRLYNYQGLLGLYAPISNRLWQGLRTDDGFIDPTNRMNTVYYEITNEGFHPLVINRTTGRNSEIAVGATPERLDQQVAHFVNVPVGVEAVGFETYPNTETAGSTSGRVIVEEALQTGGKVQFVVDVAFTVVPMLEINAKPTDVLLGSKVEHLDLRSLFEIKFGNVVVETDEVTYELLQPEALHFRTPGETRASLKVSYEAVEEVLTVPITVQWGSTIQHFGTFPVDSHSEIERTIGAYTWHPNLGIRYSPVTLTEMEAPVLSQFSTVQTTITELKVYSDVQPFTLGDKEPVTTFQVFGNETPQLIERKFGETYETGFLPAVVGDVIESFHVLSNYQLIEEPALLSNRVWQGLRKMDDFVDPTNDLPRVYYEVTTSGFRPLRVNHTQGITTHLEPGTTRAKLDQQIADFVELPEGVEVVCFERYPDLLTEGLSTGIILVEEVLQTGVRVRFPVEVVFDVEPTVIAVTLPVSMLFHTNNQKGAQVAITSESYQVTNQSNVPIQLKKWGVENAKNVASVEQLLIDSPDLEDTPPPELVTAGSVNPNHPIAMTLPINALSEWSFRGLATIQTEENPSFDLVLTITME